jgi:hypothetical protein
MARTDWYQRHPEMDDHERTCEHCRSFRRKVTDGEFTPSGATIDCARCGDIAEGVLDERYASGSTAQFESAYSLARCARCGTPSGGTHVVELGWSELPDAGLETGWGGADVWQCSQGCDLDDEYSHTSAMDHAQASGGVFLPALPMSDRTFHTKR